MIADNIQPDELINLHNNGFKLIPLDENNREVEAWTPIYDNPNYWTSERLSEQAYKFKNVATVFGKTHLKDGEGRDLYLNCLDIDSDNVYFRICNLENSNTKQKYSLIPKFQEVTFVTKTKKKNGFHIHWLSHKQNRSISTEDCKMGYEFEIKTDKSRGHCTLPPSRHRDDSNFQYKNYGKNEIAVSDELYGELIRLLADCLKDKNEKKDSNDFNPLQDGQFSLTEENIQNILELLRPCYKRRWRNDIVYAMTGLLRKNNVAKESAIELVETLAKDDEEKRARMLVLEQTYKKGPNVVTGMTKFIEVLESATGNANTAKDIFQQIFTILTQRQEPRSETNPIDILTDQLMKEYIFKTIRDTEEICYYDDSKGLYLAGGEQLIKEYAELLCPQIRTYQVIEVVNHIKRRTGIDRNRFDSNPDIINFRNGFLNVKTGDFTEHSPNQLSLSQLPIPFDPKAKCPKILRFLGEVLQPKDVFLALQIIGNCIYKSAKYEKAILLLGGGDNGKGTFIRIIEAFVGLDNTSHVSLQDLGRDNFAKADLCGKLVNTCADISAEKISNSGVFKELVSGDTTRAQRKYGQPFNFRNHAKLIYSANKAPDTEDQTYAFYKRWLILNFEKTFSENKDTDLIDKLTTPEELSGLLNLALIALKQLQKNGFWGSSIERAVKEYNYNSDTITPFLKERCILQFGNPEHRTPTTTIYNEYLSYCKKKNLRPLEVNVFGMKLSAQGVEKERIRNDGGAREYFYIGIKLKSSPEEDGKPLLMSNNAR